MICPSYITIHFPKGIINIHIFRHIHPIHFFLSFCLFSVPISLTPPLYYEFPPPKKKKKKRISASTLNSLSIAFSTNILKSKTVILSV